MKKLPSKTDCSSADASLTLDFPISIGSMIIFIACVHIYFIVFTCSEIDLDRCALCTFPSLVSLVSDGSSGATSSNARELQEHSTT